MNCLLCFSSNGKLQLFRGDKDNDIVKRITSVLPDLLLPESQDLFFICSMCLEQVLFFYTIKEASSQNCSRLKHFNDTLKGKTKCKSSEIKVIINNDKVSTHIKEEDNEHEFHNQQLVSDKPSLNHLQEEGSSCSSDITQKHKNLRVDKFAKEDSNLMSSDSRHEKQPKTRHRNQKKRFKCTDCHKTFKQRSILERHSRIHTGDKPYKCTTCQKTFTQLGNLNAHTLTHTGEKPHKCDVCHKTFNQKSYLISHKRFHNNVRPFQCAVCNKGFTKCGDRNNHMFIHTGEKPHHCHLCEYKCARASSLKTHIRRHTGEKPHSCKHCGKSFTTTSQLKEHERRRHRNEDSD